jgi:hypothetical protein
MKPREMGIGLEDRDLRDRLARFLTQVMSHYVLRADPWRNRELHRLNMLAQGYGVNEIVLAFIIFVKRYGRRAKYPYQLFLRKFEWCLNTGFRKVYEDVYADAGSPQTFALARADANEWLVCQLEDRGLLGLTHLVTNYSRWGLGAAAFDDGEEAA